MSGVLTPRARLVITAGLLLRAMRLCEAVKPAIAWSEQPNSTAEEIGRQFNLKPGDPTPSDWMQQQGIPVLPSHFGIITEAT